MAEANGTPATACGSPDIQKKVEYLLERVAFDCIALRGLCEHVHDCHSMYEAGSFIHGIDALATRAGRAADDCAELLGGKAWSDWKDFPHLDQEVEVASPLTQAVST